MLTRRIDERSGQVDIDVTVLGSSGSHTGPGRACSSYLIRVGDTQLLLDAGNGSSANLQRYTRFEDLDAILITHRHIDHCVDLVGMYYALRFHEDGPRRIPVYAADQVIDLMSSILSTDSEMAFRDVFPVTTVTGGDHFEVGPIRAVLFDSIHPVPTVSVRLEIGERVLAYSSDTAGGPELVACARDTDLFLCEATWQGDAADYPPEIHLTARDAGRIATEAGARRLVLTHLLGSIDRTRSLIEASETYDGPLSLADDNQTWSFV